MGDIFHPNGTVIVDLRVFGNQLPGHKGNIIGSGHVVIHIQSAAIDKICVFHAKPFCALVHLADKFLLTSPDMLCHGDTGSIYR